VGVKTVEIRRVKIKRIVCNKCNQAYNRNFSEKCPICYPPLLDFDYFKYKAGELTIIVLPKKNIEDEEEYGKSI